MASTVPNPPFNPNLQLTPEQQRLFFAALQANQSSGEFPELTNFNNDVAQTSTTFSLDDSRGISSSPLQDDPDSGSFEQDDSPFGYDLELDGSYDFDTVEGQAMIGRLPGGSPEDGRDNDFDHKRKSPSDSNLAEDGGGKRHEGEEKQAKKPGRKPLTSEPTSKRKAQNRAAQRAFRERKERHLKDLETKVESLEKISESTSHENSLLRAKVDKLQTELKEYRKRLQTAGNPNKMRSSGYGSGGSSSFVFDFPTFGNGLNEINAPSRQSSASSIMSNLASSNKSPRTFGSSNGNLTNKSIPSSQTSLNNHPSPLSQHKSPDSVALDELFPASVLGGSNGTPTADFLNTRSQSIIGSVSNSHNASHSSRLNSAGSVDFSASPSASASSHLGGSNSSCGTSPEPSALSPSSKMESSLNTISEENTETVSKSESDGPYTALTATALGGLSSQPSATSALDWLNPQNTGGFDSSLFNDYRDSQNDLLTGAYDNLFNESLLMPEIENNPFNFDSLLPTPPIEKLPLQNGSSKPSSVAIIAPQAPRNALDCNKIWYVLSTLYSKDRKLILLIGNAYLPWLRQMISILTPFALS
jgi:AP-1-like factor